MPHSQPRVTLLRAVCRRATPVLAEEQRERALPGFEVLGVERAQHRVALDALVERVDERVEERLPADESRNTDSSLTTV